MFRTELLPKVIREMQLLNISIDDVYDAWHKYTQKEV
jgi:hypothetical protein